MKNTNNHLNTLLRDKDRTIQRQSKQIQDLEGKLKYKITNNKDSFEHMPLITLGIHGFSVNDMYEPNPYYINGKSDKKFYRSKEYEDWKKRFTAAMDSVTNNKKNAISMFKHINLRRRIKVDVCFGIAFGYDVDNMIKSFLDTLLVDYYGLKNDNSVIEVNMKKELVGAEEDGYIAFNISNI